MIPNENLEEKIRRIKDRISDCQDYISSDFCTQCVEMYREIHSLEQELKILENERN